MLFGICCLGFVFVIGLIGVGCLLMAMTDCFNYLFDIGFLVVFVIGFYYFVLRYWFVGWYTFCLGCWWVCYCLVNCWSVLVVVCGCLVSVWCGFAFVIELIVLWWIMHICSTFFCFGLTCLICWFSCLAYVLFDLLGYVIASWLPWLLLVVLCFCYFVCLGFICVDYLFSWRLFVLIVLVALCYLFD